MRTSRKGLGAFLGYIASLSELVVRVSTLSTNDNLGEYELLSNGSESCARNILIPKTGYPNIRSRRKYSPIN